MGLHRFATLRALFRDARLPVAAFAGALCLALGAAAITRSSSERMLRDDAVAAARAWAEELGGRMGAEDFAALLAGRPPSTALLEGFAQARRVSDVFRFTLFERDGRQLYEADDLGGAGEPGGLAGRLAPAALAALLNGEPWAEAGHGEPPLAPAFFARAYAPLWRNGQVAAVAEVRIDQVHRQRQLRDAFLFAQFAAAALVLVAAALPALALRRSFRERRAAEARVRFLAHHDALTGLPNRENMRQRLQVALARARAEGGQVAALAVDLDRFKEVNDALGHAAGDALLRTVAARLRGAVREEDTVCRLGGDEFLLVVACAEGPAGAARLAERLVGDLGEPYELEGHWAVAGASIGIALSPGDAADAETLLRQADSALYRAKLEGRGTARFFEPGMDAALRERRALEHDLRAALGAGEFDLNFQPLRQLPGREVIGFEALLRWRHPRRGAVPPAEFIPVAEDTGLIVAIGAWVLREACREAASWDGGLQVAVNLSAVQFRPGAGLLATVAQALSASGLPAARLQLEITESLLLDNSDAVLRTLGELRETGVSIAMDDFGTGYSSLNTLWRFPFDKVKIDRCFVSSMDSEPKAAVIVESVVALGRALGLTVTAEGVETEGEMAALRDLGCDEGQGFLLGRPMAAAAARRLAAEARLGAPVPLSAAD